MPPTYAFDLYPANDPAGKASLTGVASRLARLTVGDQLVDSGKAGSWFRAVGHGLGGGQIAIHVDDPDAALIEKRGFVMYVRTDTDPEQPIGGFFLESGRFDALSSEEDGGRILTFSGPGGLFILDRYVLTHEVHAAGQPARGSYNVPDQWTWDTEPLGAILVRSIEEGQQHPGAFFEAVFADFTRTVDSNGNAWDADTNYSTPIGTSVLALYAEFIRLGLVVQSTADLVIQAYRDIDEFRTDRTGAAFGAGVARFEAGVNLEPPLPRRLDAKQDRSHVLIRDKGGEYEEIDEDVNFDPLPFPHYHSFLKNDSIAGDSLIRKQGRVDLTKRKQYANQAVVRHPIGDEVGEYAPGPVGDYWVLDLVTLYTGTEEHDFNETPIEVAAITFLFDEAGNPYAETELGAQYVPPSLERFEARLSTTIREVRPIELCRATVVTEPPENNWIPGDILVVHASRNVEAVPTAPGTFTGIGSGGTQGIGLLGSRMFYRVLQDGDTSMGAWGADGMACAIYRGQNVSDPIGVADGTGGSGATVDYDPLTAEAAGSWIVLAGHHTSDGTPRSAPSTYVNRVNDGSGSVQHFLHDSDGVEASFAGASVTDGVAGTGWQTTSIELKAETSGSLQFVQDFYAVSNGDLPSQGLPATLIEGDGRVELVGTSVKGKRCDDSEHFHADYDDAPTVNDDITEGFRLGTLWQNADGEAWIARSVAEGAADWVQITSPGGVPIVVQEGDATVVATVSALDFGAGFDVTESPSGEANIALDLLEVSAFTDHSARHENGGADEVSVAGLSGELADPQPPKTHATSHADAGADELAVESLPTAEIDTDLFLRPDGAGGVEFVAPPSGGAHGLDDHTDVDTTTDPPADEEVLTFESSSGLWVPKPAPSGSGIPATILDAAGDLIVASAADTAAILAKGTDGQVLRSTSSGLSWEDDFYDVEFIIDGGGSVITTGIKGDYRISNPGVIVAATLLAHQSGSIVVDIWKDTRANFPPTDADSITAAAPPTLSSADDSEDTTLTGWTTAIAAGDILRFNVDSVTTITRVTVHLKVRKT